FIIVDTGTWAGYGTYKIIFEDDNNYTLTIDNNTWKGKMGQLLQLPTSRVIISKTPQHLKHNTEYNIVVSKELSTATKFAGAVNITKFDKFSSSLEISVMDEVPERGKDVINT